MRFELVKKSATSEVVPDLLKALAILLDTTVRRSVVDREDLKPYYLLVFQRFY